jgi:pimeloyl-ACP methyl ester carboxylesterase
MVRINSLSRFALFSVSLVLLSVLLTGCTQATPPTSQPVIQFEDCQLATPGLENSVKARCTSFNVLENRSNPAGRQITLNIAVVPAVSRNPEPDPLFILVGGPGQSATEVYPALAQSFGRVHNDRDIVLVDQRGTGKSNPLECDLPEGEEGEVLSDQEQIDLLKQCSYKLNANLRMYTTDIAIQDLEQVRTALGYTQVNLYGSSYGTRVALDYLRRSPTRVRSMILDGVTSADFLVYFNTTRDATRAINLLFDRCQADPICRKTFPNLRVEFEELLIRVEQQPAHVSMPNPVSGKPLEFTMTRDKLSILVFALLYTPEVSSLLPLSIQMAYAEGNFAPLVTQAATSDAGLYLGLLYAVLCSEDVPYMTSAEHVSASPGSYFGDMSKDLREVCTAWPQAEISSDFHRPVSSDVPVLLLSGEADPITPPVYADLVAQTLPNSLHLVLRGMGHGNIMRGCIPRIAADFIEKASVEGLDTACMDKITPPPFFISVTGPLP